MTASAAQFANCIFLHAFFLTKDEQKVEHKTIFKTQEFTCTCDEACLFTYSCGHPMQQLLREHKQKLHVVIKRAEIIVSFLIN